MKRVINGTSEEISAAAAEKVTERDFKVSERVHAWKEGARTLRFRLVSVWVFRIVAQESHGGDVWAPEHAGDVQEQRTLSSLLSQPPFSPTV